MNFGKSGGMNLMERTRGVGMRYKDACEIAKEVLREITESDNAVCYINSAEDKEWLETAIKALEQEPILDKIRAEIEQVAFKDVNGSKYIFVNRVNQIIDKYKAESEE